MNPPRVFSLLTAFVLLAGLLCGCSGKKTDGQSTADGHSASDSSHAPASFELSTLSGLLLDGTEDCSPLSSDTAALYKQLCGALLPYLVTQCGSGYALFSSEVFSQEDYLLFLNLYLQQNYAEEVVEIRQNESGQPVFYFERDFYAQQYAALSPLAGSLPNTVSSTQIGDAACIAAPEMGWGGTRCWEIMSAAWASSGDLDVSVRERSAETDECVLIRFMLQPAGEGLFRFLSVELTEG